MVLLVVSPCGSQSVFHELEYAGPESLPGLGGRGDTAELGDAKGVPHVASDWLRKLEKVALRRPDPMQMFLVGRQDTTHLDNIPLRG
jgi:hypothetical protein